MFENSMIAYIKKTPPKKLLVLAGEFTKILANRINTQNLIVLLYTSNEKLEIKI